MIKNHTAPRTEKRSRGKPEATAGLYARVNQLKMFYEVHGTGKPLVLLHGALGGTGMFDMILPDLARDHQVIGVELQGHGRTADIDRPLSFEQLAEDVADLVEQLKLGKVDLLGYSLGGGVALQTAVRHPDLVRKLVLVSAPFRSNGWYPQVLAGMRAMNAAVARTWVGSPMQRAYSSLAPDPEAWPELVAKVGRLVGQEYDWTEQVASLQVPTLIVVGDADGMRLAHAVEFFELLGGGKGDPRWDGSGMSRARLAILPGITHATIVSTPALSAAVLPFLDRPAD